MERRHVSRETDGDIVYTFNTWGYAMPSREQPGVHGEACGEGSKLDKENQCL